jgi:hypothetical protein
MPTDHILALLEAERDRITRAIEILRGTHRGKLDATGAGSRARRGSPMSAEARKALSAKLRASWAKRKKAAAAAKKP